MIFLCAIWNSIFLPLFLFLKILPITFLKGLQVWKVDDPYEPNDLVIILRVVILSAICIIGFLVLGITHPIILNIIIGIVSGWFIKKQFRYSRKDERDIAIMLTIFSVSFILISTILSFSDIDGLQRVMLSIAIPWPLMVCYPAFCGIFYSFKHFQKYFKQNYEKCKQKNKSES